MNLARYPRFLVWITVGTAAAVSVALAYSLYLRREKTMAVPTASATTVLAAMQVSFDATLTAPYQYAITINVEGSRSFRMPVRFTRAGQPTALEPIAAQRWLQGWVRERAIDVARFGVLTPQGEPYLVIDIANHTR